MPSSSETSTNGSSRASSRATTTSSAAASIAVVSSPPSPCRGTRDRATGDGILSSTRCTSATAARHVSKNASVKRREQEPGGQLREEVRRLLRHDLAAARDLEDVLDPRRAERDPPPGLAAVDGGDALLAVRRVRDARRREPVDEVDVE